MTQPPITYAQMASVSTPRTAVIGRGSGREQIPGSRLEILEEDEGGNCFMLIETPRRSNQIVAESVG
jgi:hypothetical protein